MQTNETPTGFQIDKSLIDSINIKDYASKTKFEEGVVYQVQALESTEKYNNVDYPLFKLNDITLNLHNLAALYIDDAKVKVENPGDAAECMPYGLQPTRFRDILAETGLVPKQIKITRRLKQGATAKYVTGEHEVARKQGYEANGMTDVLAKEHFPMLVLRKGQLPNVADSWKTFDRVFIQPIAPEVTTAPAPEVAAATAPAPTA